ncbi:MAG TPA: hypothetical protein EYO33_33390 [Phycisphaerales bacterium]|nr:hypothetical protein [Phycisphaerales bacterium]
MSTLHPQFEPLTYRLAWNGDFKLTPPRPERAELTEDRKKAVRSLLRAGGYKPSGRGRPASESLVKAFQEERFPQIHPVVDFFNWLSMETGLPISVLDHDLVVGDWEFRLGQPGESYIFNPSGQELKVEGLLLLADQDGATGSPVKDAQRTKISESTRNFLVVVWGTADLPESLARAAKEIEEWAPRLHLVSLS